MILNHKQIYDRITFSFNSSFGCHNQAVSLQLRQSQEAEGDGQMQEVAVNLAAAKEISMAASMGAGW